MNYVFIDGSSEIAADGAGYSFQRVSSAVDLANCCYCIFTFDNHSQYRTGSDEIDESLEEAFALMFSIMFFSQFYRNIDHFDCVNGKALSFETGNHFAADVFLHAVRFYKYKSFLNVSHKYDPP